MGKLLNNTTRTFRERVFYGSFDSQQPYYKYLLFWRPQLSYKLQGHCETCISYQDNSLRHD